MPRRKTAPAQTPAVFAKGTNNAKKNRQKIGVVNKFVVFWVTAVMFPGTFPMYELPITTITPIVIARILARNTCSRSLLGDNPKRSKKSVMTTAVIEFTPESMLDMAAANIAETTNPEIPTGS